MAISLDIKFLSYFKIGSKGSPWHLALLQQCCSENSQIFQVFHFLFTIQFCIVVVAGCTALFQLGTGLLKNGGQVMMATFRETPFFFLEASKASPLNVCNQRGQKLYVSPSLVCPKFVHAEIAGTPCCCDRRMVLLNSRVFPPLSLSSIVQYSIVFYCKWGILW